jgi:1-acyl-sn-glycerol-3-phosphate acyltransferase
MAAREACHAIFYHGVVTALRWILQIGARVRLTYFGKIPNGGCVMISNHISHFDPPFLSGWISRKIDWIAMVELFSTAWSRRAFYWLDVIPVDRQGDDRHALRQALKRIQSGRMVGVFPEGGIRDGERSILSGADVREGAFLLASRSGCPVVPVVILGSERLYNRRNWLPWRRARVYIGVWDPITLPFESSSGAPRVDIRRNACSALIQLKDQLMAKHHLTESDLPHSPQERMRET